MLTKATAMFLSLSLRAWLIASLGLFDGGNGCLVVPSAAAVIAGDNVSLTCTSDTSTINGWDRGSDLNSKSYVYNAPDYYRNGTIKEPSTIVDGYSVDDSADLRVILIMNKASTVQADRYYCICYPSTFTAASVTVLVSKPTFSTINQITDGGPVHMICSVSLNGTADASMTITDVSGTKLAEKHDVGTYPSTSNDLRVISLDYSTTADSGINQTYSCQVTLSDNSKTIYSEQMVTSVQWISTRNVQIMAVDKTRCSNGNQCAINQILNCKAEGNPYPIQFQWTGFLNGRQFNDETRGLLNLTSVGNYTIQCTASNTIGYITYSNTSQYFKTEVTANGPTTPIPDTESRKQGNTALIVGLVVGLGGAIVTIAIVALTVTIYRRKQTKKLNKAEVYTTLGVQRSVTSGVPQQELYTELQTSPVDHELQNGHRVEVESYETVIPAGL